MIQDLKAFHYDVMEKVLEPGVWFGIFVIVTNAGIRMSPDFPIVRVEVWLARLVSLQNEQVPR